MTRIPHKWAKEIKAWADGYTIQYLYDETQEWFDDEDPCWGDSTAEWRIKPEPEVIYENRFVNGIIITKRFIEDMDYEPQE